MTDTYRDVHTEHCCDIHGCKYGDPKCTVVSGEKAQSYLCEACEEEAHQDAAYDSRTQSITHLSIEDLCEFLTDGQLRHIADSKDVTKCRSLIKQYLYEALGEGSHAFVDECLEK